VAALDSGGTGAESFVCVGIDITEARRVAEERRAMEARLAQSQRMESLGVLAGGIAHDFNNILMAVIGNTDLALEDLPADSDVREFLREALAGAQRAADLSTQMLAYSGRGQFQRKNTNLTALLGEMRPLLTASMASRHRIHVDSPKNLPDITADPSQLRQVVASLVCNASEAIGDSSGEITITLGTRMCGSRDLASPYTIEEHMPGMYVTLEVTDTGCGIDAHALPRLFDPFYTTKFTGRGLGLASVLGIVKAHGGLVQVDTVKGKGSTFRLLFPAAETQAETGNGACPAGEPAHKPLVLVVDDEEIVLLVMRRILDRLGYEVLAAPDGETAINLCRDHHDRLACIVLDLSMPRMDGEVTLRGLRKIRRDIPVIVASGYAEADVIRRFPGNQVQGFIQKPFSKSEFESKLTDVLDS
jgi:two-component system, cell cycle sensor histidine kinase and response regulator CckA